MNDKEHATMLLYGKDGNGPKIEVLLDKDSVWLTQKQMADLFGVDRTVIGKHLKTVFSSGELNQDVVCANFAHIASDGRAQRLPIWMGTATTGAGGRADISAVSGGCGGTLGL